MKQPKPLTRNEKEAVAAYRLNPRHWMKQKDGEIYITIVHKDKGTTKIIDKYARGGTSKCRR